MDLSKNKNFIRFFDITSVIFMPIILFFIFQYPLIENNFFTDSMFYVGYSHNFLDQIHRYGLNYYAVRFGAILPEVLLDHFLGGIGGYIASRYLLCAGTALILRSVFARRYGRLAGLLAALAWCGIPVTGRMLLSTYVDSFAAPLTMSGVLLLMASGGVGWRRGMGAGVLMALGVSANVFAAVMLVVGLPCYCLVIDRRDRGSALAEIAGVLGGGGLVLAVASLIYDYFFGIASLIEPTLRQSLALAGGLSAMWTRPASQWMVDSPYIYAPIILAPGLYFCWRWAGDRFSAISFAYIGGFILFYWSYDLFFHGYSLSFYPYFSYFLCPLVLGITVTGCVASRMARGWVRAVVVILVVGACLGPALAGRFVALSAPRPDAVAGLGLGVLLLLALARRRRGLRPIALAAGLVGVAVLLVASGPPGRWDRDDRDLMRVSLRFLDLLPRMAEDGKQLVFWLPRAATRDITMIQSTHLGVYSCLRQPGAECSDMPVLSPEDIGLLHNPQVAHLVLMDRPGGKVDAGLAALAAASLDTDLIFRRTLGSGPVAVDLAQVLIRHDHGPIADRPSVRRLTAGAGAILRQDLDGATLITANAPWQAEAWIDLPPSRRDHGAMTIRVVLRVETGRIDVAVFDARDRGRLIADNQIAATNGLVPVDLGVAEGVEPGVLMIRNATQDGRASTVRIAGIALYGAVPPAPAGGAGR